MSQIEILPASQAVIDRMGKVSYATYAPQEARIQRAFRDHLAALKQPDRPVEIFHTFQEGIEAVQDAARDAAWDAARAAAWAAAWAAARDAAWDAARAAAWDAARDAAWDAAWAAARDAARDAAWDAARDAAWDAAWDAAIANGVPQSHPQHQHFRAVWMPFVDAFEAGLFAYWIMPTKVIAVTCPIIRISENRVHGDGVPAVEWPKGERYYFWRGVRVPETYGAVPSERWQSAWILKEKNAELRRVLIQGIGYGKIARDLNAKTLDTWKEYELLRIDDVDVEPIVMVKMVCPSTSLTHAHRVPPDMVSAREAIKWCNWGIDKEEFLVER
jgi:hypothetical protein